VGCILRGMSARFATARALWVGLACWVLAGCPDETDGDSDGQAPVKESTTGAGGDSSGSSGDEVGFDGADVCLSAPLEAPGTFLGSLADKASNGGACAQGGPDAFFRISVDRRSDVWVSARGDGYEPRIGVFGNDCGVAFDDAGLLCTEGVGGWVTDLAAGTELFVAVGGSSAEVDASATGAFELDVRTRDVLSEGELCGLEAWGRCEGGTRCDVPDAGDTGGDPPEICVAIPGDDCGNAIEVDVRRGTASLLIEPDAEHTDAHEHACGGERSAERVYRLRLPDLDPDETLRIEGEGVAALAARGPTCLVEEERACGADPDGLPSITLSDVLPSTIYLFVELPPRPEGSELSPSFVRLQLGSE